MNAQKNDWNDINVAYHVALHGTLTAAAEALDVHHSTVLRRINALEARLGTRLFHRHARGYVPTEAGEMLTRVAENTQNDFDRLLGKLQGVDTQLSGTLVITTVSTLGPMLIPILSEFQQQYPQIKIEYAADSRIFKLEHGEAHIGIRPGTKPQDPDYVVQKLIDVASTLYGSAEYIAKFGLIKNLQDIQSHRFVSTIQPFTQAKFMSWMNENVKPEQIYFRASDFGAFVDAAKAGLGATAMSCWAAAKQKELRALIAPPQDWIYPLWLVTHRDMHRISKVQAFTQFIKQRILQEKNVIAGTS